MQPPEQMMGLRWAQDAVPSGLVTGALSKEAWMVVCLAAMHAM